MKEIVSIGNIEDVIIPENLEYAAAIKVLKKDLAGTGITIDLNKFYTLEPIELHNFVDTFTYCFVVDNEEKFIAYFIATHLWSLYKEITFDGNIQLVSSSNPEFPSRNDEKSVEGGTTSLRCKQYLDIEI